MLHQATWYSFKSGVAVSATCSFQCWVLESWHGNSSSFAPHKLHFHCDSGACPAWQPIASLTINLISENAVHLFGCEGIENPNEMAPLEEKSLNYATVYLLVHAAFSTCKGLTWRTR